MEAASPGLRTVRRQAWRDTREAVVEQPCGSVVSQYNDVCFRFECEFHPYHVTVLDELITSGNGMRGWLHECAVS